MANIGEIIIHGKPIAGSSKKTLGLESSFADVFVNSYFNEMGKFTSAETFIVEARFWKGVWYGVYTLMLYKGITDTADRQSYFALTIVSLNQYYCLTSEVYNVLRKTCAEYVIGKYLSHNGKYIVQDFEDDELFNGMVSKINDGWVNLQESFDSAFVPQSEYPYDVLYNIADCDSKAFVQTLRKKGRILISESVPSKDDSLADVQKIQNELLQAKQTINEQNAKLNRVNSEITNLKSGGGKVEQENRKLNRRIDDLEKEKETLISVKSATDEKLSSLKMKLSEIMSTIGAKETGRQFHDSEINKKTWTKSYLLPLFILNAVLLVLVILLSLKSCSQFPSSEKSLGTTDTEDIESIVRKVMDESRENIKSEFEYMLQQQCEEISKCIEGQKISAPLRIKQNPIVTSVGKQSSKQVKTSTSKAGLQKNAKKNQNVGTAQQSTQSDKSTK